MADATSIGTASTETQLLMHDAESEYDNRCQQIRQENAALLGEFSHWLKKAGLGAATIRSHGTNLDFYIESLSALRRHIDGCRWGQLC